MIYQLTDINSFEINLKELKRPKHDFQDMMISETGFSKSETRVQDLTIKFRILSCSETLRMKVVNLI